MGVLADYRGQKLEMTKLLFAKGADVNAGEGAEFPLHRVASLGNKEIAELLLAKGANVNMKDGYGWTPLRRALDKRKYEMAEFLR